MTRWKSEFEQGPFKINWHTLQVVAQSLEIDDTTVAPAVEELARLKKVLAFVEKIIDDIDFELTPKSVWINAEPQVTSCTAALHTYSASRNLGHLIQANENADNLLSYFRPYMVTPAQAVQAYGAAARAFSGQIDGYLEKFRAKGHSLISNLESSAANSEKQLLFINLLSDKAREFNTYLFEGDSAAAYFTRSSVETIRNDKKAIEDLYKQTIDEQVSSKVKLEAAAAEIDRQLATFEKLTNSTSAAQKDLSRFYKKIFGREINEEEVPGNVGGLEQSLFARLSDLTKYEDDQKVRHQAIFEKIEGLLPGAASAGLATAYQGLSKTFEKPVKNYTRAFYASLGVLLLCGLAIVVDSFTLWPLHIALAKGRDWDELLRTILTRAPIILPVVWFAIFSATRRSQYERLQQEYAHKQALASSYESYKKQLNDLNVSSDDLQRELIAKTIDAITFNASKTLDGNHVEKPPAMQLLEKLSLDDVKKILDLLKSPKAA